MPERREQPDRLEREINEILSNIEKFPDADQRKRRQRSKAMNQFTERLAERQQAFMRVMSGVQLSQLILLSFILILGSMFLRGIMPLLWPWLMYAGALLFLASFTLMMFGKRTPAQPRNPQYWRGRQMSYRAPSTAERLRRWWKGRSTHR
jgi:hypothetical protein